MNQKRPGERPASFVLHHARLASYGAQTYFAAPMRQIVVPQSGHLPFMMGLPFFVVPSTGSFITFFSLHFMQYASIAMDRPFTPVPKRHDSPLRARAREE